MEVAWQASFCEKHVYPGRRAAELSAFSPDFVVLKRLQDDKPPLAGDGDAIRKISLPFNLTERMQLIGGTWYGGEMKKGDVFNDELSAAP